MEANVESWLQTLWDGAAATIAWEIVVWGLLGVVVCVVAVLVFKLVTALILGDPNGPWLGAWHASVVVALMVAQMAGLLYFDLRVVFFLGLFLWLLDGALLWYGARTFSRSELVARL